MAWRALTEADILTGISGAELQPARTAVLKAGQVDPVPVVIQAVMDEARGYIAASSAPTLGAEGTIPDKLIATCTDIAVWRIVKRLPVKSLATAERKDSQENGIKILEAVARNKFRFEAPTEITTEKLALALPSISNCVRERRRRREDGI